MLTAKQFKASVLCFFNEQRFPFPAFAWEEVPVDGPPAYDEDILCLSWGVHPVYRLYVRTELEERRVVFTLSEFGEPKDSKISDSDFQVWYKNGAWGGREKDESLEDALCDELMVFPQLAKFLDEQRIAL